MDEPPGDPVCVRRRQRDEHACIGGIGLDRQHRRVGTRLRLRAARHRHNRRRRPESVPHQPVPFVCAANMAGDGGRGNHARPAPSSRPKLGSLAEREARFGKKTPAFAGVTREWEVSLLPGQGRGGGASPRRRTRTSAPAPPILEGQKGQSGISPVARGCGAAGAFGRSTRQARIVSGTGRSPSARKAAT